MSNGLASIRELYWGISHVANIKPQNRRFTSFAPIKDNLYISSDGLNSYIWDANGIKQTINLPAIALHYIKKIDHIISSVKNSTHLHFIWMPEPSSVAVHPLSFSIKTITSLFYLSKSGTLVTAGQGISFSKMILPKFTGSGPFSQLIEFSKSAELYKDEIFTRVTTPLFIESEDSVAVPVGRSLFVHSSDGSLIGSIENLMPGKISSLSFYEDKRLIVIGNEFGNVYFVEYGQFYSKIITNIGNNSHILLAALFDRYFLITVELDKTLTLINVDTESRIESIRINSEIVTARVEGSRVLIFSSGIDVFIYEVSIFTKFLTHLTANALKIERYLEPKKPSTLFCFQKDFIVSSFIGKSGRKLLELMSSSLSNEIVDFIFDSDSLFLRFHSGNIVIVEIVHQRDIFAVSNSFDDRHDNLKKSVIKVPQTVNNVVQIIKYDKNDGEKCILALSESGQIYSFSVEKGLLFNKSYIGCPDLICGTFLKFSRRFVLSTKTQMVIVDSESLHVIKRIERAYITCFFFEDSKSTLFSGDAHGCIESFELPTLTSISRSMDFNKCHSSNGKRVPLSEFQGTNEIPFAVKYLSYLKSRDLLISVSNEGEIFLWNSDLEPFAHINFSFGISAGCFYDSNGSLLVSSFECLFVIPYTYFFDHPVDETLIKCNCNHNGNEMLDEFNRLELNFDRPFSSVKVNPSFDTIKNKKINKNEIRKKKKLEKNRFDINPKIDYTLFNQNYISQNNDNEEDITVNLGNENDKEEEINVKDDEEHEFNDLVVELDQIPKNPFLEIENKIKDISSSKKIQSVPENPESPKEDIEKKPAPPSEKPPKPAPRKTKTHKHNKKPKKSKKTKKTEKNQFSPKPPSEKPNEENLPKRKKVPTHTYRHFYAQNGPNINSNTHIGQLNDHNDKENEESPPFSVEVRKKTFNDNDVIINHHLHYRPPPPLHPTPSSTFITSESMNEFDDEDDLDNDTDNIRNERRGRHRNSNAQNSTVFHSQNIKFIEPNYNYGKIGTVTMEELENYMQKNTVFVKKPTSSQRRSKSLRNSHNQDLNQRIQYNNQQFRAPKVTRVQRSTNNPRQLFYY